MEIIHARVNLPARERKLLVCCVSGVAKLDPSDRVPAAQKGRKKTFLFVTPSFVWRPPGFL